MFVNFKNGVSSMGIPLPGGGIGPVFGRTYFVDATNGNDNNSGRDPSRAKATIQAAITLQIANAVTKASLGDVIYIMPGSYAEDLTGNLTRVSLIGVNAGGTPHAVSIRPVTLSAYVGTMFEAAIRNIMILSPSTGTTEPALSIANMRYSVIDNCLFIGRAAASIEGIQLGNRDAVATAGNFDYNRITNNHFSTFYGASAQFTFGIKIGRVGYDAGASVKQCWGTLIDGNIIYAATTGIYLGTYGDKDGSTIISNNFITSMESAGDEGCSTYCIGAYTATQAMCINNRLATAAAAAAINGFDASHTIDNHTTQNGTAKRESNIA